MSDFSDEILTIKGWLPLRWTPAGEQALRSGEQAMAANENLLKALAIIEERKIGLGEEHDGKVSEALLRMEAKINLLMTYTSQILTHYQPLPEKVQTVLHADRVVWVAADGPPVAAHVSVELYLNLQIPSPLIFFGHVTERTRIAEGERSEMVFDPLSPEVQEWLEKIIFRHHRREIRRQRDKSSPAAE